MKHTKKRDIIIDLTSLLDVILILLFGVMIANSRNSGKTKIPANESQENLEQELEAAKSRADSYEYMKDVIVIYNVELKNNSDFTETSLVFNDQVRTIPTIRTKKKNQAQADKNRRLLWNQSLNEMKMDLDSFLKEELQVQDKFIYIVFAYDRNSVFQSDFKEIDQALRAMENTDGQDSLRVRYRQRETKAQ